MGSSRFERNIREFEESIRDFTEPKYPWTRIPRFFSFSPDELRERPERRVHRWEAIWVPAFSVVFLIVTMVLASMVEEAWGPPVLLLAGLLMVRVGFRMRQKYLVQRQRERDREFQAMLQNLDSPFKPHVRMPSFFRFTPDETTRYAPTGRRWAVSGFFGVMAVPFAIGLVVALIGGRPEAIVMTAVPLVICLVIVLRQSEQFEQQEQTPERPSRKKRRHHH